MNLVHAYNVGGVRGLLVYIIYGQVVAGLLGFVLGHSFIPLHLVLCA